MIWSKSGRTLSKHNPLRLQSGKAAPLLYQSPVKPLTADQPHNYHSDLGHTLVLEHLRLRLVTLGQGHILDPVRLRLIERRTRVDRR